MRKKTICKKCNYFIAKFASVLDIYIIMCYNNYSKGKGSSPKHKGYNGGKLYENISYNKDISR